jgi:hypothetical protein
MSNSLYFLLHGVGHKLRVRENANPNYLDYVSLRYCIKAPDIERAFELFQTAVGHNSFEGFREFSSLALPADLPTSITAGATEGVWKRPLRHATDQDYIQL